MLKLIFAQLGINIDQATVDKTLADVGVAVASIQKMAASQDRCEAMLRYLMVEKAEAGDKAAQDDTLAKAIEAQAWAHFDKTQPTATNNPEWNNRVWLDKTAPGAVK